MDLAYAYFADVVISRAGAGAISNYASCKSCITVPLLTAAEDHQTKNAMSLIE